MKSKGINLSALLASLALALALTLGVAAQGLHPGEISTPDRAFTLSPGLGDDLQVKLPRPLKTVGINISLGEPGVSFRYLDTLGETRVPYLADTSHLNFPFGVWAGGSHLWTAESFGRRVMEFTSTGTYLASIGTPGVGLFNDKVIEWIGDVAVDHAGNTWIADTWANHLLKFDSSGNFMQELGEAGYWGSDNNHFGFPVSIAFDQHGNIYVSDGVRWWQPDSGNQRIQIFDPSGNYLNTIGQTGVPGQGATTFFGPSHIAIYADTLYVADSGNHRVQVFDVANPLAPVYLATIGVTGVPGEDNAHFNNPMGVAVSASAIYVADSGNSRVQVFNRTNLAYQMTIGGSWGNGNLEFASPTDVAVDGSFIYVADPVNYRVQQFSTAGIYQRTYGVTGVPYLTDGYHYNTPLGLAVADDGSLYVLESTGQRLSKFDTDGALEWTIGEAGVKGDWTWDNEKFNDASDLALDTNGHIYVADQNHSRVQVFTSNGAYLTTLHEWNGGSDYFICPGGIGLAPNGYLYVAEPCRHRVVIFTPSFAYVASLGVVDQPGDDNNHFNNPSDVAIASDGTIYVVDVVNARLQVYNQNYSYQSTLGVTGEHGGGFDHFSWPSHAFLDGADRLYVSDQGNHRVQVFDASGAYLATVGGSWGDGSGQFWNPRGMAVNGDGNLFVADSNNHRIQVFAMGYPGWVQTNIDGFGRGVAMISTLTQFGSYLYAGSWDGLVFKAPDGKTWTEVTPPWSSGVLDAKTFGSHLYLAGGSGTGEIWRTDGSNWSQVVSGGFGDANNSSIDALSVFSGALYAATNNSSTGIEIWRSQSGNPGSWTQVNDDNFGQVDLITSPFMDVFNGRLYVGVSRNLEAELWRSSNGTTWEMVFANGLGNPNNTNVVALAEFNGYFYVAFRNSATGGEVWRSVDGMTGWTKVVSNGLGNPLNSRPYGLIAFDGHLYLAFSSASIGAEVWRSADGLVWEQVAKGGWGDPNNWFADYFDKAAAVFGNRLYIATFNMITGGEIWKKTVTADFTASPRKGVAGFTVQFTNTSTGDYVSSLWDFGDGSSSTETNPTHTYGYGDYTVSLTVSDGVDIHTCRRVKYIQGFYRTIYLPVALRKH